MKRKLIVFFATLISLASLEVSAQPSVAACGAAGRGRHSPPARPRLEPPFVVDMANL